MDKRMIQELFLPCFKLRDWPFFDSFIKSAGYNAWILVENNQAARIYEWVQFHANPNKNPDLVDLQVFYLIQPNPLLNCLTGFLQREVNGVKSMVGTVLQPHLHDTVFYSVLDFLYLNHVHASKVSTSQKLMLLDGGNVKMKNQLLCK